MTADPAFQALNPRRSPLFTPTHPIAPLITGDHSADNQRIWQ